MQPTFLSLPVRHMSTPSPTMEHEAQAAPARRTEPTPAVRPRLRYNRGLWLCFLPRFVLVGYGYTPEQAYAEWWAEQRARWVKEAAA